VTLKNDLKEDLALRNVAALRGTKKVCALVLVRLDHVASGIVNADHSIM